MSEMLERMRVVIEQECAGIMGKRISSERARIFAMNVLDVMREPTKEMLNAPLNAPLNDDREMVDTVVGYLGEYEAKQIWRAMVGAAEKNP